MKRITLLLLILNLTLAFAQNAPIDFEPDGFGASWTWATFEAPMGEENPVFSVVANPAADDINGSATVAKMDISYATDAGWGSAGCESMHGSDIGTFAVTEQNKIVKMSIYQEGFAAPVALKFAVDHGGALFEAVVSNSVADQWVEVEFNMSEWIGHPLGSPDQIIFFPSYGARATGHTVYFDNVTFGTGSGTGGGDAPTVGAPIPTHGAANVISVFSDTYDNVSVENLNPDWGQATVVTEESIEGNNTLVYKGLNYQGLQLDGTLDVSGMTHLHLDYWTANSTALNAFLISDGPVETASSLSVPTSGWASADIPLTAFSPVDLAALIQFKFDGTGDIYLDNIYFYKGDGGTGGGSVANTPIDFEPDGYGASWTWATFEAPMGEENPTFSVVANPSVDAENGSATVAKMDISYATDAAWGSAGCETMHGADIGPFTITNSNKVVKMMIYQEGFAAPVAVKFASASGFAFGQVIASNTVADAWVEVEFDMSEWIGAAETPDQFIFFPSHAARATGHVVYFDNVTFNATGSGTGGVDDAPMVGAPVPTRDAANVISVFSDTYDNVPVENLNPDWGQATAVTEESIGGNNTLVYKGLNYQGLQLDGTLDVSGMTHLHLDYWTANSTALNAFLISDGPVETASSLSVPTSGWASVDIPLTAFSPVDLAALIQFKFDGTGDIYLDNIYFYKGEGGTGGGDAPMAGAPVPTRDAANVISVFSDTYDNVPVENLNPDWGQATQVTEEEIGGNNTLVYKGLNYQGLQLDGTLDVSGMTHLHLDYWTANSTALNAFLISDGPVETPSTLAVPTSGWASVDIPLTAFSPVDLAALIQFKFDGTGDIYLDNIYFYKGEGGTGGGDAPMVGAPVPTRDAANVISVFSDTYDNVPVENLNPDWGQATQVTEEEIGGNNTLVYKGLNYQGLQLDGTLDVSGMTHLHLDYWTANSTALNAFLISDGPVETPSTLAVPTSGWASVDIPLTAFSPVDLAALIQFKFDGTGDIYLDNIYFYKGEGGTGGGDAPTVGAPEPIHAASDVISVFSDSYENVPVEDLNPNWGQATVVTEEEIGGNNTLVYKGLNYQGLQLEGSQDVSGMTHLHLDYWTANSTALNAFIISPGPVETPSVLTVPTSGWASVDIPLTEFTPVDLMEIFQFKFDGNGDIYLDNIYFHRNIVNINTVTLEEVGAYVYPNPAQNNWTLKTDNVEMSQIQVFDMAGKQVLTLNPENNSIAEIDASRLNEGMYFAQVTTPKGVFSMKLIKE